MAFEDESIGDEPPPQLRSGVLSQLDWRKSELDGYLIATIPDGKIFDDIFEETRRINGLLAEFTDDIPPIRVCPDYASLRPGRNDRRALSAAFNGEPSEMFRQLARWNLATRLYGRIDGLSRVRGIVVSSEEDLPSKTVSCKPDLRRAP